MTSTTGDLNRFLRALLDGRLLRPAQLTQMQDTVATNDPLHPGAGYGLGLEWRPLPCGGGYWGHGGNGFGYSDENGVTPDGGRSVVVSLTSRGADLDAALRQQRATDALIDHALCAAN